MMKQDTQMFFPERFLLCTTLNFRNTFIAIFLAISPIIFMPKATAGMFGISIPANYGKWFTQIYQLYLDNQDLIANARKLYTAYLTVSNTIDALEGLNSSDRATFTTRWRRNMRVLLETQIYFAIDEEIFQGRASVNQLLQEIVGLDFDDDGNATVNPNLIQALGIHIAGDRGYWEDAFLNARVPDFPTWFITDQEYVATTNRYLDRQEHLAFSSFRKQLKRAVSERILEDVARDPLLFLLCNGKSPCYSPFNFDALTAGVQWSWDQMLANMYDRSLPLHNPMPLEGELEVADGLTVSDYEQYLHRRVSSAVWRAMGEELKTKLTKTHLAFSRRCNEINAAVYDVQNLAKLLEDLVNPLDSFEPDASGSNVATLIATSLSISADGWAEEQAKMNSFFHGRISKKIETALSRAKEVKQKLLDTNQVFTSLLDQIAEVEGKQSHHSIVDGFINTNFTYATQSLVQNQTAPHSYVGSTPTMSWLSAQINDAILGGSQ
jgi:hypothetical protein